MTNEKETKENEQIDDAEKFENKEKDVIDEKVFLKWALEKRKNEYESIKRRYVRVLFIINISCNCISGI